MAKEMILGNSAAVQMNRLMFLQERQELSVPTKTIVELSKFCRQLNPEMPSLIPG